MNRPYAERTDVLALLADLGRGAVTVEEAAARLRELLVPAVVRVSPVGDTMALLAAEQDDSPPPYTPNSWDDVTTAYVAYRRIDREQYAELRRLVDVPPARTVVWENSDTAGEPGRWAPPA